MGVNGECVGLEDGSVGTYNLSLGHLCTVAALDDDLLAEARLLVGLDTVGDVLHKVFVVDFSSDLADDNGVEGVPFADYVADLDVGAILEVEFRTVWDVGRGEHHAGLGIDDAHFGKTADNHFHGVALGSLLVGLYGAELLKLEDTVVARSDGGDGCDVRSHTADVERTEGELRTGFAD